MQQKIRMREIACNRKRELAWTLPESLALIDTRGTMPLGELSTGGGKKDPANQ